MKKIIGSFLLVTIFSIAAFAQGTVQERTARATAEFKDLLQSKLSLTAEAATSVSLIETEFYTGLTALYADTALKQKERNVKEHDLHVTRRTKLMALPLTGREMEDVIDLHSAVRYKHKL